MGTPIDRSKRRGLQLGAAMAAGLILPRPTPVAAQIEPTYDADLGLDPPIYDADVGLDPGHSRIDVGAAGAGVGEYRHTLDVALRSQPLLEAAGLRVNLTRANHEPLSAMANPDPTERTRIEQFARTQSSAE